MDVWLAEVQEEDVPRRLAVERQHRLAVLLADTRARLARLVGSVAVGSLLSQGVASRVIGQLLARVSFTVRDIHLRVLGGAADAQGASSEFVLGVVCKLVSLASGPPDAVAAGSCARDRIKLLVLDGLSVYWHKAAGAHASSRIEKGVATAPADTSVLMQPVVIRASMRVVRQGQGLAAGRAGSWVLADVQVRVGAISVRAEPEAIKDMSCLLRNPSTDESRPPLLPQRASGIARPTVGYKKAAAWLQYASACIACRTRRERLALHPEAVARRVKDLKRYRLLYAAYLRSSLALFLGEAVGDEGGQAFCAVASDAGVDQMDEMADLENGLPLTAIMALRDSCQGALAVAPLDSPFPAPTSPSAGNPGIGGVLAAGTRREPLREPLGYFWWLPDLFQPLRHTPRAGAEKSASDAHHATPSLGLLFLGPEGRGEEDALSRVSLCVSVELENLNMELCGRNRAAASSAVSGAAGADAVARIHVGRFCPRFRAASALSAPPPIFPCLQLHRNIHLCLHVFCCHAAWSMTSGTRVTGESSGARMQDHENSGQPGADSTGDCTREPRQCCPGRARQRTSRQDVVV